MPVNILMPALSPTMTEGTLAKWMVKEGDLVKAGDILAEIETDKATMEFEAVDEGRVGKILVPEGSDNVAVNTPIAVLLEEGEDASSIKLPQKQAAAAEKPVATNQTTAPPRATGSQEKTATAASSNLDRLRISPLAKRIATESGIDFTALTGSGPHGRIIRADIDAFLAGGGVKKMTGPTDRVSAAQMTRIGRPAQEFEEISLNNMRKTIARRLVEAKQTIPHFYLVIDVEIDALLDLRSKVNAKLSDAKVSVNDFIIKASALALRKIPNANACWGGDKILKYNVVDVAVAVALDGGLITPLIRDADKKSIAQISSEMKDLAGRAKAGKLMPEEYQGGSFSISNLGMYGIREFSAVINPPHGAILAVGAGEKRPVIAKDGSVRAATLMTCTLSCDHRVIDGALGAQLLAAFKELIEDPIALLL